MVRRSWMLSALLLTISCSAETGAEAVFAPQFANAGLQQSVHGRIYIGILDEKDTFTAVRLPNGSVTGHFNIHSPTEGHITGRVLCFTIVGNTARIAGIVESADDFPAIVGGGAMWTVVDTGEGNDPPDISSDIRYGVALETALDHCEVSQISAFELQRIGNIQINP